jgi:branched-chain amino acid transport system substrate-binding protein
MRSLLLTSISALFLASCGGGGSDVVRIGVAGPMTGDQSVMGEDLRNGVELAVTEWNSRGGVLGMHVEMVIGDDRRDPKEAVSVANKLINDGCVAVIGHFNSSCSIPASEIYHEFGIVQISPASTNPQLTEQGYRTVFRTCGRDDQQGAVAADFVSDVLGAATVAVLDDKTTYGQGLADEFVRNLGDRAEVVIHEGIVQGDQDFTAVLTKVREHNPDVIYFGGIYPEAGQIAKQMRQLNIDAIFVSGDGVIDPKYLEIAGDAAEGTYLSFGPDVSTLPSAEGFVEKYTSAYGEIGPYSIYSYDAANIALEAIEATGSTEGAAIGEKIHAMVFEGALGTISFDDKGDVSKAPYIFWVVEDCEFVPCAPPDVVVVGQ